MLPAAHPVFNNRSTTRLPHGKRISRMNAPYPPSLTFFGLYVVRGCPAKTPWDYHHLLRGSGGKLSCPKVNKRCPKNRVILKFLPKASYCLVQRLRHDPILKTPPGIQGVEKVLVELCCNFHRLRIVGFP